jgi:CBS-domain-containing membrane protein
VTCLKTYENALTVYQVLKRDKHNGYPVVNERNELVGVILRHQLIILLETRAFQKLPRVRLVANDFAPTKESIAKRIEDLSIIGVEHLADFTINLNPFMNKSFEAITPSAPLTSVYRKFRNLCLRHLIVITAKNNVAGIITRKEVMTDFRSDLA